MHIKTYLFFYSVDHIIKTYASLVGREHNPNEFTELLTKNCMHVVIYDFAWMIVHLLIEISFKHNMLVILFFYQ